jgi:hypothetical protein
MKASLHRGGSISLEPSWPLAVLPWPPLTEEVGPLAVLNAPPLIEDRSPLAVLWNPPLQEGASIMASARRGCYRLSVPERVLLHEDIRIMSLLTLTR